MTWHDVARDSVAGIRHGVAAYLPLAAYPFPLSAFPSHEPHA